MATLATTNIKHASSSSNNIVLNSDGTTAIPGHIIQVVQHTTDNHASTTGQTFVTTNLTGSITTTHANSKILVMVSQNYRIHGNASTGGGINLNRVISGTETILDDGPRNSTGPYGVWIGMQSGAGHNIYSRYNIQYLDSPNQAAGTSITYNTKMASYRNVYVL